MDHGPLFLDVTRRDLRRADAGIVVDRPGWLQVTEPAAKVVWRNMVHHAVIPEAEVDETIRGVLAHYAAHDVPFLWRVTPNCRPLDLGERLEAHGLAHFEQLACLVADPADFQPPDDPRVRMEEVTPRNADTYIRTLGEAWGMPEQGRRRFRRLLDRALAQEPRTQVAWLARLDDEPLGVAVMAYHPRSIHFSGSAVVPRARGRGLYRAMILHRMARLRAEGRSLVTVHAVRTTSAPICKRMGFREVCTMDSWCHPPSEAASR